MQCLTAVSYYILLIGSKFDKFTSTRLRQRDPISSYLFIFAAESLLRILAKSKVDNQIHGLKMSRQATSISPLFYADNILLFFRANESEVRTIMNILDKFSLIQANLPLFQNLIYYSQAMQMFI